MKIKLALLAILLTTNVIKAQFNGGQSNAVAKQIIEGNPYLESEKFQLGSLKILNAKPMESVQIRYNIEKRNVEVLFDEATKDIRVPNYVTEIQLTNPALTLRSLSFKWGTHTEMDFFDIRYDGKYKLLKRPMVDVKNIPDYTAPNTRFQYEFEWRYCLFTPDGSLEEIQLNKSLLKKLPVSDKLTAYLEKNPKLKNETQVIALLTFMDSL